MAAQDLRRVRELFDAVERLASHERHRYLQECDADTVVRMQLSGLIHAADTPSGAEHLTSNANTCHSSTLASQLEPGTVLGDFEIVRLLGRGAAGAVYLARQTALDRLVALKVTSNRGTEARTMARLKHRHIVQVYSESVDISGDSRVICMQYVPGATLAEILKYLRTVPRADHCGAAILAAIDKLNGNPHYLDEGLWRDRERLAILSYDAAVCWIVARLAEALHFAHLHNVLHHDIKPANILIDKSGCPYLADFGFATRSPNQPAACSQDEVGGTLAYMAPEQLDAFVLGDPNRVTHLSDVYSLGLVLREMLTLQPPHTQIRLDAPFSAARLEESSRRTDSKTEASSPGASMALEHVVARCLASDLSHRIPNAGNLARALDGCRGLIEARARVPRCKRFHKITTRFPGTAILALSVAGFLPHLFGNVINPAYNALVLFPRYDAEQELALWAVAAAYAAIVFPVTARIVVGRHLLAKLVWCRLHRGSITTYDEIDRARRTLLAVPCFAARVSIGGWLPLLWFVPVSLHALNAGLSWSEFAHFAASVILSMLILTPYTWLVLQYFILQYAYVDLWADTTNFSEKAAEELANVREQLHYFQAAAAAAPMLAAAMLLAAAPNELSDTNFLSLRALTLGLIVTSMIGLWLAMRLGEVIRQSLDALQLAGSRD